MTFRPHYLLELVILGILCRPCVADFPASAPSVAPPATQPSAACSIHVEILAQQSCEGLGACQGASVHDGFVYLYGDLYQKDHQSGPGVIRQYDFRPDEHGIPRLTYTGLEIRLTRHGDNLDNAVLNIIDDGLAVQGCRPEFVRHGDRWLLATADYGQLNNAVRLYDPALLADAKSTCAPGVLVQQFPCTPWVQQLHWIDAQGLLIIAQNQIEGRRWRLTPAYPWHAECSADFRSITPDDEIPYPTELEGFSMIDREHCVLVNSSSKENVSIARLVMKDHVAASESAR